MITICVDTTGPPDHAPQAAHHPRAGAVPTDQPRCPGSDGWGTDVSDNGRSAGHGAEALATPPWKAGKGGGRERSRPDIVDAIRYLVKETMQSRAISCEADTIPGPSTTCWRGRGKADRDRDRASSAPPPVPHRRHPRARGHGHDHRLAIGEGQPDRRLRRHGVTTRAGVDHRQQRRVAVDTHRAAADAAGRRSRRPGAGRSQAGCGGGLRRATGTVEQAWPSSGYAEKLADLGRGPARAQAPDQYSTPAAQFSSSSTPLRGHRPHLVPGHAVRS